jgi:hypothetical protein
MKWISVGKCRVDNGESECASYRSSSPQVRKFMVQKYSKCWTNLYMGEWKIIQVREYESPQIIKND